MEYIIGNSYGAYCLENITNLDGVNAIGYIFRHNKTKARVVVISNDDDNKVFTIGFRTPPSDDTGVPHILEHSVLCGSRKFPSKDPFVELAKGSLNTFLNAMTYSDKTVYPIASCNEKDFHNLMDVYLDAVFYPNIYKKEEILKQEGWHYELEDVDSEITYNGVVYNEMKGVFSSPEEQLMRAIQSSLLKDTPYSYESGGDPDSIPDLSYEDFLNFHKKYYHPSNSYIYLYGDMDFMKELSYIDEEYLSDFDEENIDSAVAVQTPYEEQLDIEEYYSISDSEELEDNTYFSYNVVVGTSLDTKLYVAFQILDYVLLSAPGAVLKKALIDSGIGNDIFSSYDNGILQPTFSIISKGANDKDKEAFINTIRSTLVDIISNGIEKRSLLAAINFYEFKYKEANFGRYPKGLMYGLQMFDSWLYDDKKPFIHLQTEEVFKFLKEQIDTKYFENLIKTYILENNHSTIVTVKPKKGLVAENEKKVAKLLAEYKDTLSDSQLERIIKQTKDLKKYQQEPSSKEDLEKIPLLNIEDIEKKTQKLYNEELTISDVKVIYHDIFTNGIGYIKFAFNINNLSEEMMQYASLLLSVFKQVDTTNYSCNQLSNEVNINTGGIGFSTRTLSQTKEKGSYIPLIEINAKTFYDKIDKTLELMEEILYNSKLDDKKRLKEIISETKSQLRMSINQSGNASSANRALSYIFKSAYQKEIAEGIGFYEFIAELDKSFNEKTDEIIQKLILARKLIFRKDNFILSYTGDNDVRNDLAKGLFTFKNKLYDEKVNDSFEFNIDKKNEGFKTSSKVQYVATAGNYLESGIKYTGSLSVLQVIFSYEYLWINIRVKGGAYGAMCSFTRSGQGYFTSYRDPNLYKTYEIYKNAAKYVAEIDIDDRDMKKYIIGTISNIDTPLTPAAKGDKSFYSYLLGYSMETYQKERDEILATTQETIRSLAPAIKAITDSQVICAIGNENKIEEEKEYFKEVKSVF